MVGGFNQIAFLMSVCLLLLTRMICGNVLLCSRAQIARLIFPPFTLVLAFFVILSAQVNITLFICYELLLIYFLRAAPVVLMMASSLLLVFSLYKHVVFCFYFRCILEM